MNKGGEEKKKKSGGRSGDRKTLGERTSVVEWIVAAVGLALVVLSVGYIAYTALTTRGTPPDLEIRESSVKRMPEGFLVEFSVVNRGDATAANVVIEGRLLDGEEEVQVKTTTINYVASGSVQKGGLFFTEDPGRYRLEVKAIGFERP